jgi:hypothetical protein
MPLITLSQDVERISRTESVNERQVLSTSRAAHRGHSLLAAEGREGRAQAPAKALLEIAQALDPHAGGPKKKSVPRKPRKQTWRGPGTSTGAHVATRTHQTKQCPRPERRTSVETPTYEVSSMRPRPFFVQGILATKRLSGSLSSLASALVCVQRASPPRRRLRCRHTAAWCPWPATPPLAPSPSRTACPSTRCARLSQSPSLSPLLGRCHPRV